MHLMSYNNILCNGKIKMNDISGNQQCGVYINGRNNKALIEQNFFIGFNKMAGIKLENEANATIIKNTIMNNMGQGILIVEKSSAHIESN